MNSDQVKDEKLPFLFAPAIKQGLLNHEMNVNPEGFLLSERADSAMRRILTWSHLTDIFNWGFFFGAEFLYDLNKIPENYHLVLRAFGHVPEDVRTIALDPKLTAVLDNYGDVFEVTSLHIFGRAGMAAVNEGLRSKPAKEGVKAIMNNEKFSRIFTKLLDKETQERYATSGEIQLSDEARFWIPLATTMLLMTAHSLGYIDFGENHWHGNDPVPFMLRGHFVAATSLVAWHYAAKYPEKIKQIVVPIMNGVKNSYNQLGELTKLVGKMSKDVAVVMKNAGENIESIMRNSGEAIEERVRATSERFNTTLGGTIDYVDMETRIARLMLNDSLNQTKSPTKRS